MARKKYQDAEMKYRASKRGNLSRTLDRVRRDSKSANKECDLDLDYLESIVTDVCPVFKTPFIWGQGKGRNVPDQAPSIDKVIPELGYVKGNVVFISFIANKIKQNVTEIELYAVADWLHDKRKEVLNAFKGQSPSIPIEYIGEGKYNPTPRTIHGTGTGEDCDGSHHHRGEPEGEDTCNSPKKSCRICMGSGVRQMEALELYVNCEDYGLTGTEVESIAKLFGCICCQS